MARHPVDQVPSAPKLAILSVQHVLAFYAGAVIVPLLIAQGLWLSTATTIHLVNADLLTCGIATILQSAGLTRFVGVRLPIIQGVTTTAVAPIIAIGAAARTGEPESSLPAVYGAVIVSGLFTFLAAPYFARLLRFFPPVVTGTVLLVMGTSLLAISADDFVGHAAGRPAAADLGLAFGTLAAIVLIQRLFTGFLATIAVLVGLVGGTLAALAAGGLSAEKVDAFHGAAAFDVTTPLHFGAPRFTLLGCASMIVVMLITMVETTGDVFATGEIVGRRIDGRDVAAAIRADGASTLLGGVMNSFPYTCFAQNVGLVGITRVRSRWVATGAGAVMVALGTLPKAGAVVATIPPPVLGGASLVMFATVSWVGLQTIARADMRDNRNAIIVAASLGLAMLVTFKPDLAKAFPEWARILFGSGMTTGAIAAILLNVLFFHVGRQTGSRMAADAGGRSLTADEVNGMDEDAFVSAFRGLVNTQTWPLRRAWAQRPFADASRLRGAFQAAVFSGTREQRLALLSDYPDIAELLRADEPTAQRISKDIGSLALDSATPRQLERLDRLSADYREKFGWPLVAYLSPVDTPERIIENCGRRLCHTPEQEELVALSEVVDIAGDRLGILLAEANPARTAWKSKLTGE